MVNAELAVQTRSDMDSMHTEANAIETNASKLNLGLCDGPNSCVHLLLGTFFICCGRSFSLSTVIIDEQNFTKYIALFIDYNICFGGKYRFDIIMKTDTSGPMMKIMHAVNIIESPTRIMANSSYIFNVVMYSSVVWYQECRFSEK